MARLEVFAEDPSLPCLNNRLVERFTESDLAGRVFLWNREENTLQHRCVTHLYLYNFTQTLSYSLNKRYQALLKQQREVWEKIVNLQ